MISVVICSRESNPSSNITNNIASSIGTTYELIVIDNSTNQYTIFQAYNLGISRSKGEIVCFIHDDILFHTNDWGKILQTIFEKKPQIGLVGVAGSKIKTKMPSAWWDCPEDLKAINIIQHFKEPTRKKEKWYKGFEISKEVEVAVIDGVFMALKRETQITFNNKLDGFHNYDLNLSLDCHRRGFKVIVTNRVLLEHFSIGSQNKDWYRSTIIFHELYKKLLPVNFGKSKKRNHLLRQQEFENGVNFIRGLLKYNFKKEAIKYWLRLLYFKPYAKFHFDFLKTLIIK